MTLTYINIMTSSKVWILPPEGLFPYHCPNVAGSVPRASRSPHPPFLDLLLKSQPCASCEAASLQKAGLSVEVYRFTPQSLLSIRSLDLFGQTVTGDFLPGSKCRGFNQSLPRTWCLRSEFSCDISVVDHWASPDT